MDVLPNITESNSKIIKVRDVSVEGDEYYNRVELKLIGDHFELRLKMDTIGGNGLKLLINSVQTDVRQHFLATNNKNQFGCYYQFAYLDGGVTKHYYDGDGNRHEYIVNPSFEKTPARTTNEKGGQFNDIDEDGLFVYCPIHKQYQHIWFAVSTQYALVNAFDSNVKFIVMDLAMNEPTEYSQWYCTLPGKLSFQLETIFPRNRHGELDKDCYGYVYGNKE